MIGVVVVRCVLCGRSAEERSGGGESAVGGICFDEVVPVIHERAHVLDVVVESIGSCQFITSNTQLVWLHYTCAGIFESGLKWLMGMCLDWFHSVSSLCHGTVLCSRRLLVW